MGTIEFQCILTIFPFDGGHSDSGCFFDILMSTHTKALSLLQAIEKSTASRTIRDRKRCRVVNVSCKCKHTFTLKIIMYLDNNNQMARME